MKDQILEELKTFILEEIYLLPEDQEAILAAMKGKSSVNQKPASTPIETSEVRKSEVPTSAGQEIDEIKNALAQKPILEPIPIKGNFSKGVLILHEESEPAAEVMEMLVKMINAVGHSMNEVGLVSSENLDGRSMEDFVGLNAHIVLKFGRIKHPINALPAQLYEIFTEEETEYLFADSLTVISEDKLLKKKLWDKLQILFNIPQKK
jgi:hypothetical protein